MPVEEASQQKVFAAEKGLAGIRVAIIALNSVVYHFGMSKAGTIETLAYIIIVAANAYGLFVFLAKPYERYPAMMSSYFTTALDAAFITLWLIATGGFASPFYLLWMVSVTAVAFRYGFKETVTAAVVYAVCYLGMLASLGAILPNLTEVTLRIGYIFFTAAIGGLLARETSEQTRAKVEFERVAGLLRESEDRFRTLSDATFEGIVIHEHGRILQCNRSFARLFGFAQSEVAGRSVLDFFAPESQGPVSERLRLPSDQPYEATGLCRDGTRLDLELVARSIPYQGKPARVTAVRDVTERKRAEREARERETLQALNDRLREIDRLKTQFINNAAHELGTPLTPIKIQAHILRGGSLGPLTPRQERALVILQRNVEHLAILVKDVLDAARVQAGKLAVTFTPTELDKVLAESVESFQDTAEAQGVRLEFEAPKGIVARIDRARITQVVFNLLQNALKFTPHGGIITVRARATPDEVIVEVQDTGAGIPTSEIGKLFQPFSQVHDRMQAVDSGTGLGLYVARGIIEQHGGSISCASAGSGHGSTFRFALPLSPRVDAGASARVELATERLE